MKIEIRERDFDPWRELAEHQAALNAYGATAAFVGTMRDFNESESVHRMTLEHYPGMTEKHLHDICTRAAENWRLNDILLLHRVGEIFPGDPIVLVVTWSAHRREAYDANRFIMEDLKSSAPLWKKEDLGGRERWVEKNTPGY